MQGRRAGGQGSTHSCIVTFIHTRPYAAGAFHLPCRACFPESAAHASELDEQLSLPSESEGGRGANKRALLARLLSAPGSTVETPAGAPTSSAAAAAAAAAAATMGGPVVSDRRGCEEMLPAACSLARC